MTATTKGEPLKIELQFPMTEGEKDLVRHLLDSTVSVEDHGGKRAPTLLAPQKGGIDFSKLSDAEKAPAEPKAEAAPKAKKSATKVEAAPEPVEEVEAAEPVDSDDTDYIQLATDKAVELIEAKDRDTVRNALKAAGVKRVSEVKDQGTAKELYEALIA